MPLGAKPPGRPEPGVMPAPASRETCQREDEERADGVIRDRHGWCGPPPVAPVALARCPSRGIAKDCMDTAPPPTATLVVCTTCKRGDAAPEALRPGSLMHAALAALPLPEGVTLRPTECLSACSNGCSVALQARGKWSYVYGNLDPALHAPDILRGAGLYAASRDGIVTWRDRPEVFRKQSLARIPPLE